MKSAHRVVKNTGILYLKMLITFPITLYTTRVLLEALGVDDFGLFFLVAGIISMFMFLNASLSTSTQRFMSYAHGEAKEQKQNAIYNIAVRYHFIISVLVGLLLLLIAYPLINGVLNIDADKLDQAFMVFCIATVNVFIVINTVPLDASINANERMDLFAKVAIGESVFKLLIALIILEIESEYRLVIYSILFTMVTLLAYFWKLFYTHSNFSECYFDLKTKQPEKLKTEMVQFAGWSLVGTSSSMVSNYGQALILNIFFGTIANAAHAIAAQLNGQLSSLAVNMMKAVNPIIVKSEGAGNRENMHYASFLASKFGVLLLSLIFIPLIFNLDTFMEVWLAQVPEYVVIFCFWLLIRTLTEQVYLPLVTSIDAVGDIKNYQIFSSILALSPLIASITMFQFFSVSAQWLYINFFIYSLLNGLLITYFAKQKCNLNINYFFKNVILRIGYMLIVVFVAMYLLFNSFSFDSLDLVFYSFLISTTLIFLSSWILLFTKQEKKHLSNYVQEIYLKVKTGN